MHLGGQAVGDVNEGVRAGTGVGPFLDALKLSRWGQVPTDDVRKGVEIGLKVLFLLLQPLAVAQQHLQARVGGTNVACHADFVAHLSPFAVHHVVLVGRAHDRNGERQPVGRVRVAPHDGHVVGVAGLL